MLNAIYFIETLFYDAFGAIYNIFRYVALAAIYGWSFAQYRFYLKIL